MISHYRLQAELGRGGMGIVYRARDEHLARDVALKVLLDDTSADRERRASVLREARAAAALNHPGIVTIYEVGVDGPHLFLSMELVTGRTLRTMSADGPLTPQELARLGAQVADALAAAHARGVIHGDIKPENVVVQPNGRVKLLDFGIARHSVLETVATTRTLATPTPGSAATLAGTLAYMAPEQLRGLAADHRADLFALGVVCYELALGRRPFLGATPTAIMAQIVDEEPLPPDASSKLPSALVRIIWRLLEKKPAARYQSASDVQLDLTNAAREIELGPALPAAIRGKRTVAVLPFKLLTRSADDEYLSVALVDAIINDLNTSGDVLVRPIGMVQRYAKEAVEPLLAARELNVHVIVEGSIQKLGPKLRVHLQALDATTGSSLLSAKYDGEMVDLFNLQDTIADSLARALGFETSTPKPIAEVKPTKNRTAYELFLRASDKLSRLNHWETRAAIDMLEHAVQLDPRFGAAWARMAEAHLLMAFTFGEGSRAIAAAERAVRRALALDSSNSVAQCSHALVLWSPARGFQNRAALRALKVALKLSAGNLPALLWQVVIFLHVGLFDRAEEGLKTALAVRPDDATTIMLLGQSAMYRHQYAEADEYHKRALAIDATHSWTTVFYPVISLYRGALDDAEQKLAAAREVQPEDPWLTSCEALLWAKRGEIGKAQQMLSRALRGKKPLFHTHHMWHTAAAAYALLDKPSRALSLLEKAAAFGLPNYTLFRDDPHFRPLHESQRFKNLMTKLKRESRTFRTDFDTT
jgi:serine/threonine protein kinase